jgi:hypothetical protein
VNSKNPPKLRFVEVESAVFVDPDAVNCPTDRIIGRRFVIAGDDANPESVSVDIPVSQNDARIAGRRFQFIPNAAPPSSQSLRRPTDQTNELAAGRRIIIVKDPELMNGRPPSPII